MTDTPAWVDDPDAPIEPELWLPKPHDEVTPDYLIVDTTPFADIALFRVVHHPPSPGQTAAQVEASRRGTERHYLKLSISRHLARIAAGALGFPARCTLPLCRRARRCAGSRHEFDWSFPGPWMPPCGATSRQVEQIRAHTRAIQADWVIARLEDANAAEKAANS